MSFEVRQLTADDIALMEALSTMFGEAFNEVATYTEKRPERGLRKLPRSPDTQK